MQIHFMSRYFSLLPCLFALPLFSFGQQWKTFKDTAGNFSASYPSNWINKVKAGNRVFFTSPSDGPKDNFYENINISVTNSKDYGSDMKVTDLFPGVTKQLAGSFRDFREEGLRYFKWNKVDAAELIYSGYNENEESVKIRCIQWFCFYDSKLYIVTFAADASVNKHNAIARRIMGGIVFR